MNDYEIAQWQSMGTGAHHAHVRERRRRVIYNIGLVVGTILSLVVATMGLWILMVIAEVTNGY